MMEIVDRALGVELIEEEGEREGPLEREGVMDGE